MYLWRAVDDAGEALDVLVQKRRNKHAALKTLTWPSDDESGRNRRSAQRLLSSYAAVNNTFNTQPHLISRPGLRTLRARAHRAWALATVAA